MSQKMELFITIAVEYHILQTMQFFAAHTDTRLPSRLYICVSGYAASDLKTTDSIFSYNMDP
jgi:hypothetical protein